MEKLIIFTDHLKAKESCLCQLGATRTQPCDLTIILLCDPQWWKVNKHTSSRSNSFSKSSSLVIFLSLDDADLRSSCWLFNPFLLSHSSNCASCLPSSWIPACFLWESSQSSSINNTVKKQSQQDYQVLFVLNSLYWDLITFLLTGWNFCDFPNHASSWQFLFFIPFNL